MERVNGRIVVSVLIIMAAGVYRVLVIQPASTSPSATKGISVTRIIVAGYILGIVASIIDLVGGPASAISGLLLVAAVVTVLYTVIPDLFQRITARQA